MKRLALLLVAASLCILSAGAQNKIPHSQRTCNEIANRRTEIILPQVRGFNCYKADFHIHTAYSDGAASITGRVDDAHSDR